MNNLLSSAEVAKIIGCSVRSVHRAAKNYDIGLQVGRSLAFSVRDIANLRAVILRSPGNPDFGKVYLGGGWPKGKKRKPVKKKKSDDSSPPSHPME